MKVSAEVEIPAKLKKKLRYVSDPAYAHQYIEAPIKDGKFDKAYQASAKLAQRAQQKIASMYEPPEPGVTGPAGGDAAKMKVSEAILNRMGKERDSVSVPGADEAKFNFFNRYAMTYATRLGGESVLAGEGVWRIWVEGIPYWSPEGGKTWVFLPKKGYGKYGKGVMVKIPEYWKRSHPDRYLEVLRQYGPIPLTKRFKSVWHRRLPVYERAIIREFKKRWRSG